MSVFRKVCYKYLICCNKFNSLLTVDEQEQLITHMKKIQREVLQVTAKLFLKDDNDNNFIKAWGTLLEMA